MRLKKNGATKAAALVFGAAIALATFMYPENASASDQVGLGTASSFAVLAGTGVTNTGPSVVNGDLGTCPTPAVTGFPPGVVVGGVIHANDAVACDARADMLTGWNDAAGRAPTMSFGGPTDLGGMNLATGVYNSPSSLALTGTLILDAAGDPNAVFVFQMGSTLVTATNSTVELRNGAQACNVFWQVGSSATLGVSSNLVGSVLAAISITANTDAQVLGRLLAHTGATTLDSNRITVPGCVTAPATTTSTEAPTSTSSTPVGPTTTTAVTPTTIAVTPTTVAVTPTTVAVTPTTAAPTATTVAPTATTVAPTATTVAPTPTTAAPTATTVAPTATTVAPTATTVAPTATTVAPTASTLVVTATTVASPHLTGTTVVAQETGTLTPRATPGQITTATIPTGRVATPASPATPTPGQIDLTGGLPETGSPLMAQTLIALAAIGLGYALARRARSPQH